MRPRDVIRLLKADGWHEVRQTGSHRHFKHPTRPGLITVPDHPGDLDHRIVRQIEKLTGLSMISRRRRGDET